MNPGHHANPDNAYSDHRTLPVNCVIDCRCRLARSTSPIICILVSYIVVRDKSAPGSVVTLDKAKREIVVKRLMRQTWRWFGPEDKVSTIDARQAGAEGLVCSLYHVPPGTVWALDEIEKRQAEARTAPDGGESGMAWE